MRLTVGLIIITLTCLASCQTGSFPKPNGPYRLTYDVKVTQPPDNSVIGEGQYSITEKDGHLLIEYSLGGENAKLEFEDGRSLLLRAPVDHDKDYLSTHSSIYSDGFDFLSTGLALYMPFQFQSVNTYGPLKAYQDELAIAKATMPPDQFKVVSTIGNCNTAIITSPGGYGEQAGPAYYRKQGSDILLTAGVPEQKSFDYVYSHLEAAVGVQVPSRIVMTWYESVYSRELKKPLPPVVSKRYTFTLKQSVFDPLKVQMPKRESLLEKGMWITYKGYGGKGAGVLFNPDKGSLDHQLGIQLAMKKNTVPLGVKRSSMPIIPMMLAAFFGLLALGFMFSRRLVKKLSI